MPQLLDNSRCINRSKQEGTWVNDKQCGLNPTRTQKIVEATSLQTLQTILKDASEENLALSVAGAGYATGGQQFATNEIHLDTSKLNRILNFDSESGLLEVEAGIRWTEFIPSYLRLQRNNRSQWGIVQKQTGSDHLSVGGALSVNIHGRGLQNPPFVSNIESFKLVDAQGKLRQCSRTESPDMFQLAIGGYGLFGIVYSVTLQLEPRHKVQRFTKLVHSEDLIATFNQDRKEGFTSGHFQFAIDPNSTDFLRKGLLVSFKPIETHQPVSEHTQEYSPDQWLYLLYLAHVDKANAFKAYADYFQAKPGELFWSDTHQLGYYLQGYHKWLDHKLGASVPGSEVITELFVPPQNLETFLHETRKAFISLGTDIIYGTIRLVEQDQETFLRWAKQDWACVVLNIHTSHDPEGLEKTQTICRTLIDIAHSHGGTYYLPYHKWVTREQVEASYSEFQEFLRLKQVHDPQERFQSNWYRHYRTLFSNKRGDQ